MDGRRKLFRINRRRELGYNDERTTREAILGSPNFMQRLRIEAKLDIHRGCVNTICWNDSGYRILSGSDDKQLCITDPYLRKKLATIASGHRANIFSAKFMPCCNDSQIISCSGDGQISFNNVENTAQHGQNIFNCHYGTAYEVVTIPNDPNTFLSCGEDGTVRWFDLRTKSRCLKDECREDVLINCRRAVTSLAVNPIMPYQLGVGCSDSSVRVFDRRMLGTRSTGNYSGRGIQGMFCRFCPPHLQNKYNRPTSLQYSASGNELLVSYSSDYIYLFGTDAYKKEIAFARQEGASEARGDASGAASFADDENPVVNPIKRLRLRGDWSDTGPKARPRGEQAESQPRLTIIQRMSEMLTRWLDDSTSSHARRIATASTEGSNQEVAAAANEPGTSTAQPTSSRFSSLQSTSTEEQSASQTMQKRLKDSMTSRMMNKKPSSASTEEPGLEEPGPEESPNPLSSPTQVDQVTTSSQLVGGDAAPAVQGESSEMCISSPGLPENETESERLILGNREILQEGSSSTEGISAISSSVQSCMQIRDSQTDSCPAAQDADGEIMDASDGNSDSKKRKRSTHSSLSSSSLTDDPALDTVAPDGLGKLRGKRNSKTQRRITEDGSEDGSSSSDSDDDELANRNSSGAENLAHKQSRQPQNISPPPERDTTDCSEARPSSEKYPKLELDKTSEEKTLDKNKSQVSEPKDGTLKLLRKTGEGACLEASTSRSHGGGRVAQQEQQEQDQGNQNHPVRRQSEIFALRERMEDTNPQERHTGQFTTANQRQRRVSVSGPAGTPPPAHLPASSSCQDLASQAVPEDRLDSTRGAGASASTAQEPESRSITCSESDSDDDFVLRPPRRRRHTRHESNEEEVRRPRTPSVSEFRFRELIRAKREAKEREELQLSNVMTPEFKMVYKGHRNSRTMIKQANFWGSDYVLSGSDCGHIFIWDRHTAELVMLLEGDKHVVNCVQPHPFDHLLATSGIDYDVKLWSPTAEIAHLPDDAAEVMRINELMLDETRDTITVPPSFMLRMLASLNHLRAERRRSRESGSSSESTEEES
ncbi:DDB1- and CUL4-associated factor 6-like isoform X1 [Asterias amurensis]|uniref:DDB1- and CUL4-associated factor 6-like isoform X1 n=1 Tax=Asterias amurensis TaxID=7602 RepID=UPI003AB44503